MASQKESVQSRMTSCEHGEENYADHFHSGVLRVPLLQFPLSFHDTVQSSS